MSIYFPSHSITIKRQRSLGGLKYGWSATFTVYAADIQPVEAERVNLFDGRIGNTYEAWIDSTVDIKESDQVLTGGRVYSVRGVETYEGAGLLEHKHLILMMQD